MPGPTDSFRFEIDLEESGYVQGANRVRASSQSIDAGLQALTDGLYGVNSAFQLIRRSGSGYVSAQEVLQSVNVQTTQSIESQIAALEHLKSTTGGDAAQIRQLAQMQEQLASSYRLTASEIEAAASGNITYANALIRLNSLGIQTTEQLEMQANELMRLQDVFKGDEQAVRSLTTALDALFARMEGGSALDELNSMGIETTEQINRRIEAAQRLQQVFASDEQAVRRLKEAEDALRASLDSVATPLSRLNALGIQSSAQVNALRQELVDLRNEFQNDEDAIRGINEMLERLGATSQSVTLGTFGITPTSDIEAQIAAIQRLRQEHSLDARETLLLARAQRELEDALNVVHPSVQALNNLGVQTSAQIRERMQLISGLISAHEGDAQAVAALRQQYEQLRAQLTGDLTLQQLGITPTAEIEQQIASINRLKQAHADDARVVQLLTQAQAELRAELSGSGGTVEETTGAYADLNEIGVQATAQILERIEALELLKQAYADDQFVVAQLTAQQEQLRNALASGTQESRHAQQALFSLGFIIDDSRQFTFGFAQGLRAISNNLQPVIQQLSYLQGGMGAIRAALMGPAGVILLVNALTLGIAIWAERMRVAGDNANAMADRIAKAFRKAGDEAERAKSRVEVLTTLFSSMVDIETPQITLAEDIPRLRELVNSAQRLRDARTADVAALEQQQRLLRSQISQIRQQQQESAQFGVSVREVAGDYEEISRQLEEVTSQLSLARYQTGIASTMAGEWSRNLFEAEVALEGIRAATGSASFITADLVEGYVNVFDTNKELKETLAAISLLGEDRVKQIVAENAELQAQIDAILEIGEETTSAWQELLEKNRELKADLAVMRDIDYDRWGNIVQQNKELEIQIARFERLAELSGLEQAFPQAFDSAPLREAAETLQSMAIPSSTNRQLQQTLSYLQQIGVIDPSVDITVQDNLDEIRERLRNFDPGSISIPANLDASRLQGQVNSAIAQLGGVVMIPIEIGAQQFERFTDSVESRSLKVQQAIRGMLSAIPAQAASELRAANEAMREEMLKTTELYVEAGQQIAGLFSSGAVALTESLVTAAAQGRNAGAALIGAIGDIATQVGAIMVKLGIAAQFLNPEKLLTKFGPAGAIAAGLALVAIGSAAKASVASALKRGTDGGGGGEPLSFTNEVERSFRNIPQQNFGAGPSGITIDQTLDIRVSGTLESRRGAFDAEIKQHELRQHRFSTR